MKHLLIILGDQLDPQHAYLHTLSREDTLVWMAEVRHESTKVWSHKARMVMCLSAMRHFAQTLRTQGWQLEYHALEEEPSYATFQEALTATLHRYHPDSVYMLQAGEWDVQQAIQDTCDAYGYALHLQDDPHFLCSLETFKQYAQGKKHLRLEFFYRMLRQTHGVLMREGLPEGGAWNFDAENRGSFGKKGPPLHPEPLKVLPDTITQQVIHLVDTMFPDHPGDLTTFDWAVTPDEAQAMVDDFIEHRLPLFGLYQDAMWQSQPLASALPYLFHARISAALNLKLLNPRVLIRQVEEAYHQGKVSLASAEGFIRQVLGWREYVRGIYWQFMPGYRDLNDMNAQAPLPTFYWDGNTKMNCLHQSITQTLTYGYAHHIQRLMVTGLFALLLGVRPQAVHAWYLAMYVDAIEWVELPNTLGMSQFGDGGLMSSKPYIATGKYIQRMSNYCTTCPYDPALKTGEKACPFTTLYWAYLMTHETRLAKNPRMSLQVKNLHKLSEEEKQAIQQHAYHIRQTL
ncbi:MAG: cryptochrome/photolyase family protein [Vampirovibrionales bacterium]